jgi:hypothetical protein
MHDPTSGAYRFLGLEGGGDQAFLPLGMPWDIGDVGEHVLRSTRDLNRGRDGSHTNLLAWGWLEPRETNPCAGAWLGGPNALPRPDFVDERDSEGSGDTSVM